MNKNSLFVLFLATIFCGQFLLFSNDSCPSIFDFDLESDCVEITSNFHPGAHFWFQAMIKKYPQAHLDKMRFCASTTYEAGVGVIYFPEYTLNSMDEVFNFSSSDPITQKMFDLFAEDEYLLMHEAMHVLCNDAINFERASFGSIVGASLISLILFAQVVQGEMSWQTQVKGSVFGAFVAYVALSYYSQFQEIRADGFANQNCDENALRAGICWFKRLDTVMNLENITVPESVQLILKFLQYHKHPLPQKRIDQASKALTLRFAA